MPATARNQSTSEEPTRLFSVFGLAEDTNDRFHYLPGHQRTARLSTAFAARRLTHRQAMPTASSANRRGGLAIDTVEDMIRLYTASTWVRPAFLASMTISGPAPIIMAMYIARLNPALGRASCENFAAQSRRIFLRKFRRRTRLFPDRSVAPFPLRYIEYTTREIRAGIRSRSRLSLASRATRCSRRLPNTLDGFAYAELLSNRGVPVDQFGPRSPSFWIAGLMSNTSRSPALHAESGRSGCATRSAGPKGQMFKLHDPNERPLAHCGPNSKTPHENRRELMLALHEWH